MSANMPSNDIQLVMKHTGTGIHQVDPDDVAASPHHKTTSSATYTWSPSPSSSSELSFPALMGLLATRDEREMRQLRHLLRQHLTWQERLTEWSKFILNVVVAIVAVIVGIQTLQSRVQTVQSQVDTLGNKADLFTSQLTSSLADVSKLQSQSVTLNGTMMDVNRQLTSIMELSIQLAENVKKLHLNETVAQVNDLNEVVELLRNQTIQWNTTVMESTVELSTLYENSTNQIRSLVTDAENMLKQQNLSVQTQLTQQTQIVQTQLTQQQTNIQTQLNIQTQTINQNITTLAADVSRRAHAVRFCNLSSPTTGSMGGYPGAAAKCRSACSSPTAFMCQPADVLPLMFSMNASLVLPPAGTSAWVHTNLDCWAWTGSVNNDHGSIVTTYGPTPALSAVWSDNGLCVQSYPIMCCDYQ